MLLRVPLPASANKSILQSLRNLAARPVKCVAHKSSDIQALSDALTRLGLETHTEEFVGNGKLLALAEKLQLLVSEEVTSSDMKTLFSSRAFLCSSSGKFSAVFSLCKRQFPNGECVGKVLAKNPGVVLQSIEHLERKFKHLDDFHVGTEARLRLGAGDRGILVIKEDCLQKRLAFLQEIGLSVKHRDRVICRWPRVLLQPVESSMRPTVEYLTSRGMDRTILLLAIQSHPGIFGFSIEKNLAIKFDTLSQMGLTTQECCKAIRYVVMCSRQCMLLRLDILKNQGFSDHDICSIIRKFPSILSISEDNIKKKIDYLVNVENRDLKEIVRFPACLGYSLEQRIIPRFSILKEMGLPTKYSMSHILADKREAFMKTFKIPQSVKIIS